jgi:hypothetical protein
MINFSECRSARPPAPDFSELYDPSPFIRRDLLGSLLRILKHVDDRTLLRLERTMDTVILAKAIHDQDSVVRAKTERLVKMMNDLFAEDFGLTYRDRKADRLCVAKAIERTRGEVIFVPLETFQNKCPRGFRIVPENYGRPTL